MNTFSGGKIEERCREERKTSFGQLEEADQGNAHASEDQKQIFGKRKKVIFWFDLIKIEN